MTTRDADRPERDEHVPDDLPLYEAGQAAGDWDFVPGDAFWSEVTQLAANGDLTAQLDVAMAGKSAPRTWLILHRPTDPELGALVALAFAKELGSRDQATIVLDCDDRQQSLTRWTGRVEADGWIDVARYGASVLTAGQPMPFAGRQSYLLGVGSFAPTDVTEAEIGQMMTRLRHQGDDLILVAPADASGQKWAAVAGIRLLCWDRAALDETAVAALVATWAEGGYALTGLVGFGEAAVTRAAAGPADGVAEGVAVEAPAAPVVSRSEVDEVASEPDLGAPEAAARVQQKPSETAAAFTAPDPGQSSDATDKQPSPGAQRHGTSGVFWFVLSAAVVIVGVLGVYWFQYVRVPEGNVATSPPVVARSEPVRPPADITTGELANQDDALVGDADSTGAAVQAADSLGLVIADTLSDAGPAPGTAETTASAPDSAATVIVPAAEPAPAPAFVMAPYRTEVGSLGWALHLYSLPSEAKSEIEVTELHRRGFQTAVRAVDTEKKGRWWRVYVGSFATRAEASQAAVLLKEKLRTDWAAPVRF